MKLGFDLLEILANLKKLGIDLLLILAGGAGAFVSMGKQKDASFGRWAITIVSGCCVANYLTPVVMGVVNIGPNGLLSMAFITGFLGFKSILLIVDLVNKKFRKKQEE